MLVSSVWAIALRQGCIQVSGLSSVGRGKEEVLRYRHGNTDRPRGPRAIVLALVITPLREASGRRHATHPVRALRDGNRGLRLAWDRPAVSTDATRRQGSGGGRRGTAAGTRTARPRRAYAQGRPGLGR